MKLNEETWLALWAATGQPSEARAHWETLMQQRRFDEVGPETQRLIPAIFFNLRGDQAVTERERLRGAFKYTWSKNTRMLHDMHPLIRALHARGIDFRVIKGAAVQARIGQVGTRTMGDMDLVIWARDAELVGEVMDEQGFRRTGFAQCPGHSDSTHFQALTYNRGETHVDVHVAEAKYPSALLQAMLVAPVTWARTAGGELPTPPVEHLILHAGAHGRLGAGPSDLVQTVLDVSLLSPFAERSAILSVGQRTGTLDDLLAIDHLQGELDLPNLQLNAGPLRRIRAELARSGRHAWASIVGASRVLTLIRDRRRPPESLVEIRRRMNGHRFAYALWLRFGQFSVFERIAVRLWGGFLAPPTLVLEESMSAQPFLTSVPAMLASNVARQALDWRVRMHVQPGVDDLVMGFASAALDRLDAAVYVNGVPITRFAVGDTSNRELRLSLRKGAIEVSIRPSWSVCSHCYAGLDDLGITVTLRDDAA